MSDINENESSGMSRDISPLLKGWDYESGTINVRRINGLDGSPKLQMRLDLGLVQMELSGRPDGARPHGKESLLQFHEESLIDYKSKNGSEEGFELSPDECSALREEAGLYYQRYLSLSVLEDYGGVVRDTARNLRVLDLCGQYASEEQDRLVMEQYRPYITMMNTRAAASIQFKNEKYADASATVAKGLERIKSFFERFGQPEAYDESNEVKILKQFAREIRRKLPIDPIARLRAKLDKAVKAERYEEAAKLRDEIQRKSEAQA